MTSRERLLAAMRLQPVDRLPIHMRGVRVWDEDWVNSRHPSYQPVIEAVREHCDYCAGWEPAMGTFLSASDAVRADTTVHPGEDWNEHITVLHTPGGELTARWLSSNRGLPGLQTEYFVKEPADVEKAVSVPYEPLRPDVRGFFDLAQSIGERGVVICGALNPFAHVHDLMGSELAAMLSITHRKLLRDLVWVFAERLLELVCYLLDQGVGPIFGSAGQEYCGPPLMSPRNFREFCTEPEKPIGQAIRERGHLLHIHCHGPLDAILADLVAIGANVLHPIEAPPMGDMPLAEAKRRIGDRVCLEGNIQIGDIYAGDTGDIGRQVQAAVADTGGRGFILCPSASPHTEVLPDQAVRNYVAMIEAGRQF